MHQHLREPLHALPSLLRESGALQGGLGAGDAPAAAGPAAQLLAETHSSLPALGDVPHGAAGRQPLRSCVCSPAEPLTCRGGAGEGALRYVPKQGTISAHMQRELNLLQSHQTGKTSVSSSLMKGV